MAAARTTTRSAAASRGSSDDGRCGARAALALRVPHAVVRADGSRSARSLHEIRRCHATAVCARYAVPMRRRACPKSATIRSHPPRSVHRPVWPRRARSCKPYAAVPVSRTDASKAFPLKCYNTALCGEYFRRPEPAAECVDQCKTWAVRRAVRQRQCGNATARGTQPRAKVRPALRAAAFVQCFQARAGTIVAPPSS